MAEDGEQQPVLDRLALEEGRAAIAEQRESLEKLRGRATGFVATVLAVSGFVGSQEVAATGCAQVTVRVLALLATFALAALAAMVLSPRKFTFTVNATTLAGPDWAKFERPEAELAKYLGEYADKNDVTLEKMHAWFQYELIAGSLAVALWLVQVWL